MDENSAGVMIALLPTTTDWCKIDLPHMTLVYAGLVSDLKPGDHNDMAKEALSLSMACPVFTVDVLATDIFGEENDTDVLLLRPVAELMAMRSAVDHWDASDFPFTPHTTVGPRGSFGIIPMSLTFDKILVQWGIDRLVFNLCQ